MESGYLNVPLSAFEEFAQLPPAVDKQNDPTTALSFQDPSFQGVDTISEKREEPDDNGSSQLYSHLLPTQPIVRQPAQTKCKEQLFYLLWNRMHKNPKYHQYRQKTAQTDPDSVKVSQRKWWEHLEYLFIRGKHCTPLNLKSVLHELIGDVAIVEWPPRQRDKVHVPDREKSLGRNETVSHSINRWLGFPLEADKDQTACRKSGAIWRKEVSSHVQVIKKYFEDEQYRDDFVLFFLPKKDRKEGRNGRGKKSAADGEQETESRSFRTSLRTRQRTPAPYYGRPERAALISTPTLHSDLSQPLRTLPSQESPTANQLFEPYTFSMFIKDQSMKQMHTFTSLLHASQVMSVYAEDFPVEFPQWKAALDKLARVEQREEAVDCENVILADVSLAVLKHIIPNARLSISTTLTTDDELDSGFLWRCHVKIYEGEKLVWDSWTDLQHCFENGKWLHELPFASEYWVRKFGYIERMWKAESKGNTEQYGYDPNLQTIESYQSYVARNIDKDLRNIVAVHEIVAFHKGMPSEHDIPQTYMKIYWRFKPAHLGQRGITMWMRVLSGSRQDVVHTPNATDEEMHLPMDQVVVGMFGDDPFANTMSQPLHQDLNALATAAAGFEPYMNDFDAQTALASLGILSEAGMDAVRALENPQPTAITTHQQSLDYPHTPSFCSSIDEHYTEPGAEYLFYSQDTQDNIEPTAVAGDLQDQHLQLYQPIQRGNFFEQCQADEPTQIFDEFDPQSQTLDFLGTQPILPSSVQNNIPTANQQPAHNYLFDPLEEDYKDLASTPNGTFGGC